MADHTEKAPVVLRVTVEDVEAGTTEVVEVPEDEYFILATGRCHVAHVQAHANGTHVLTVKGRRGL